MPDPKGFYQILELTQSATIEDVRINYKRLARIMHPDKNDAEDAKEKFQHLLEAYCGVLISSFG